MCNRTMKNVLERVLFLALTVLLVSSMFTGAVSAATDNNTGNENSGATISQEPMTLFGDISSAVIQYFEGLKLFFEELPDKLYQNFIEDDRYKYLIEGFCNTIVITIFALILGLVLGTCIAIVRTIHDLHGKLKVANAICKVYLAVIRGTPVMLQLLIIYFVIFAAVDVDKVLVAVVAFGVNSAAYVAEIIRAGINAVPKGQFEAGASLGLPFKLTMMTIILPQAVKNILPALCNEGITLMKETAISGYIGLVDLTKAGDIIRSQTWEAFIPLIAVALVYLVMVLILTHLVQKLERRLNNAN
ncbi:MAG TPA: amino acid ABC transporter permease [Methanocorpusculum sp.]|nr:amino acid ABC transporter permease [Methanocorpusculum sp.]